MSKSLRPYAVSIHTLEALFEKPSDSLTRLLTEEAAWFERFNAQIVRQMGQGAPLSEQAIKSLQQGKFHRAHFWLYKRVVEHLCQNLGRLLPNEHLKHLDVETLEFIDAMLDWLEAPMWLRFEPFIMDGRPELGDRLLDRLGINWLDNAQCEAIDDFFAHCDWDEIEEQLEVSDTLSHTEIIQWRHCVPVLKETEACFHDIVQHASGLILFE